MRRPPRMYFSFRSPRSWLALRRLEERRPDLSATVRYVPHWTPEPWLRSALAERGSGVLETPLSRAKHDYLVDGTDRLVRQFNYRMTWPADLDGRWDLPHLAWLSAQRQGLGTPFYRAAVRARWERGENICDPVILRAIAAEAGLDPQVAVDDESLRAEAVEAHEWAFDDDIFAVPYFIVGRHRCWGLERLDDFTAAMDATAAKAAGATSAAAAPPGASARESR